MPEWTKVSGSNNPTWDFDENSTIEGQLIRIKENVGPNASRMYVINVNGKEFDVWGATALNKDMDAVNLKDDVKIVYEGLKLNPKTNRKFKSFQVYSAPHGPEDRPNIPF